MWKYSFMVNCMRIKPNFTSLKKTEMASRRNFLRIAALSAGILSFDTIWSKNKKIAPDAPVVISTWSYGISANAEAWKILIAGGRSLDAVEKGVMNTESDLSNRSVGLGGLPDRDGHVTLDACIMDENANCGAVAFLEGIMHPVSVARTIMEKTPHIMLAGDGALQFALENGFQKEKEIIQPESKKAYQEWLKTSGYNAAGNKNHDTIGLLAMDMNTNLSGACTTSGLAYKLHGRIGDSPIIGAGLFVDNNIGAATSTGVGEETIRIAGSHTVVEMMRNGKSPADACKEAVMRIIKNKKEKARDVQVAFLAINKNGEYGAYAIQKGFTYAVYTKNTPNVLFNSESYFG